MRPIAINESSRYAEGTQYFNGYNHCLRTDASEIYDCRNMTMDEYPFLASRHHRRKLILSDGATAKNIIVADVAIEEKLYINALIVQTANSIEVYDSDYNHLAQLITDLPEEQKIVIMGGYLICFPSTYYHNILNINGTDKGYIGYDISFESSTSVSFTPCDENGKVVASTKPDSPSSGTLWNDNGKVVCWSEYSNSWTEIQTYYCLMDGANTGFTTAQLADVKLGDIVEVYVGSGARVQTFSVVNKHPDDVNSDHPRIILKGYPMYSTVGGNLATVHMRHRVPSFNYVFESNNRIWGCYYGVNDDGEVINEIYASALGDFRNFYKYEGISTDAWTATVGVPGEWTGGCKYGAYPTFFKENSIIRIYGEYPSTFGTYTSNFRGVKRGNDRSICMVNETLYYNTCTGIVAYTGGVPSNIDLKLHETFETVISGGYKGKLYLNCIRPDGSHDIFVYDTVKQMWIKEDNLYVDQFVTAPNTMYIINSDEVLIAEGGSEDLEWFVETSVLGLEYVDHKYISRIQARIEGEGSICI